MFFRLFSFAFGIGSLYKSSPLWIIWCRGIGVAKETLLLFHHSIFFFHHLTLLLLKAREAKGNSSYYQLFLHPTQSIRFFGPESLDEFLSIRTSLLIFFFRALISLCGLFAATQTASRRWIRFIHSSRTRHNYGFRERRRRYRFEILIQWRSWWREFSYFLCTLTRTRGEPTSTPIPLLFTLPGG